jgi:hypothetical protein
MRLKLSPIIVIALFLALIFPSFVAAQSSAARYADDALRLAPVVIGLFGGLAGLGAVVGAGLYARENKSDSAKSLACIVAAIGGITLSLSWFGLSLLSLIGSVLLAVVGAGVCLLIAES